VAPGGANYQLIGTQFNGLSQAVAYGDDYQASTNCPLVRITNSGTGHVFYARTHGHSTMAVATGSTSVSTEFDVPAGIETGASTLVVVANGIASQSVSVNVGPSPTPSPIPSPTPTPGGTIALSANPVVFPNAGLDGVPTHHRFIIQNLSAKHALVGNVGSPVAPFSILSGGGAFNIPPVGMKTVRMFFKPTGLGLETSSLLGTSDAKNRREPKVERSGLSPKLLRNPFDSVVAYFEALFRRHLSGRSPEHGNRRYRGPQSIDQLPNIPPSSGRA
jgi:hypothetical protein